MESGWMVGIMDMANTTIQMESYMKVLSIKGSSMEQVHSHIQQEASTKHNGRMEKWSKEITISKMIYSISLIIGSIVLIKTEGSIKKYNKAFYQLVLPNRLKRMTNHIKYQKAHMVIIIYNGLDVGEGYYEPVKSLIYSYDNRVLRIPSEKEVLFYYYHIIIGPPLHRDM